MTTPATRACLHILERSLVVFRGLVDLCAKNELALLRPSIFACSICSYRASLFHRAFEVIHAVQTQCCAEGELVMGRVHFCLVDTSMLS